MGGNADLEEGSTVERDVVVIGGNLQADGVIEGDVNIVGGLVRLGSAAVVEGDVNALSANLLQDEGAEIEGQVNTDGRFPFFFGAPSSIPVPVVPGNVPVYPDVPRPSAVDMGLNLVGSFLWWLGRSFVWAFLALLALMFWPRHIQRVADAAMSEPVPSAGLGILTVVAGAIILTLIALTICGIPISLVGVLVITAGWALGIIALGLETGARIERLVHQDWAPPVQAAVGTFILTLVINGIGAIWCVGWLVPFLVGTIGLGAALLTRFGSQPYPLGSAVVVNAPPPPAPYTQFMDEPPVDTGARVDADDDLPPTF
jgi:hypothetical protein